MFSNKQITTFTGLYSQEIERLRNEINTADAIVVGAGAGLSESAGFSYTGKRFEKYFQDFRRKYGINDMYSGGFYPYITAEEYWAWWSRHIWYNRYATDVGKPYSRLLELLKDKDYFVLTTNVDHQFQKAGFDKQRLFYTQGDYGLWQCRKSCCERTFDNEQQVKLMVTQQQNMKIPSELIPRCPLCNEMLTMNLRCDDGFVQDEGWYAASKRYSDFIKRTEHSHVLFLELGVGSNTPVIIKYPFWLMSSENPNAVYACLNQGESYCPTAIENRSICIDSDIGTTLGKLN